MADVAPPIITVQVTWDEGTNKGTVRDIKVPASNGPTQIEWITGLNVEKFAINDLDPAEFTPAGSSREGKSFLTIDRNDNAKTYSYTVNATHIDGRTSTHDPKIENGT